MLRTLYRLLGLLPSAVLARLHVSHVSSPLFWEKEDEVFRTRHVASRIGLFIDSGARCRKMIVLLSN